MTRSKVKKVSAVSAASTPQVPVGERIYLSPEEIEKKSKSQIVDVYVEELGGWVRARVTGADRMIYFLKSFQNGTDAEKVESMGQLVADTLCNEDGSDYVTLEQALKYSSDTLDDIIGAVSKARKEAKGNA